MWKVVKTFIFDYTADDFHESVSVYIERPEILRRSFSHAEISSEQYCLVSDLPTLASNLFTLAKESPKDSIKSKFTSQLRTLSNNTNVLEVVFRDLVPKRSTAEITNEVILIDKATHSYAFCPLYKEECWWFILELRQRNLSLYCLFSNDHETNDWLINVLCRKLISWCKTPPSHSRGSLCLVDKSVYLCHYQNLKAKHAQNLKAIWRGTDPDKFIHEDIAICAYLLTYWGSEKQVFVDICCGNGLLVYLLDDFGHLGSGIDLRGRPIWSSWSNLNLKEKVILPEDLFENADWIIGNHSDELTPWIPVIAARSNSNFCLIPCCQWDFKNRWQGQGGYHGYVDYIASLGSKIGFTIKRDKLRIPSTRRECIIGLKNDATLQADHFLQFAGEHFQPRPLIEPVRNASQINKRIIEEVINLLLEMLLVDSHQDGKWRQGSRISMKLVVDRLGKKSLQTLKQQCGGLQTLIRNQFPLFVCNSGHIQIRDWLKESLERQKSIGTKKSKFCPFLKYHPDGCPCTVDQCCFKHENV